MTRLSPFRWLALVLLLVPLSCASTGGPLARAEARAGEAESSLDDADRAMEEFHVEDAGEALAKAKTALADPDASAYPEFDMLKERLAASEQKLGEVRAEKQKREHEKAVADRQARLDDAQDRLKKPLEALKRGEITKDAAEAAREALGGLLDALEAGKELEGGDAKYASFAADHRKRAEAAHPVVKTALAVGEFLEGPGADRREGLELLRRSKAEKEPEARRDLLGQALEELQSCAEDGKRMLDATPSLGTTQVVVDGAVTSPKSMLASCQEKAGTLTKAAKTVRRDDDRDRDRDDRDRKRKDDRRRDRRRR